MLLCSVGISELNASSVDPDQILHPVAYDLGLHCLPMSLLWDVRLKLVKVSVTVADESHEISNLIFLEKYLELQSTLVISNSKRLSEILHDIHTSTYQICRIEEKIIRLTTFNKYICN